jgi:hypothetical protein
MLRDPKGHHRREDFHPLKYATPEILALDPLLAGRMSAEERRRRIAELVVEIDAQAAARRERTGIPSMGAAAILAQDPHRRPRHSVAGPLLPRREQRLAPIVAPHRSRDCDIRLLMAEARRAAVQKSTPSVQEILLSLRTLSLEAPSTGGPLKGVIMIRNHRLCSLFASLILLALGRPLYAEGLGTADVGPMREELKRLHLPGDRDLFQNLWVWNLGDRAVEVKLGSDATLRVPAGSFREVLGLRFGHSTVPVDSQVVLVASSHDFDPSDLEFDLRGTLRQGQTDHGPFIQVIRPVWAQRLLVEAASSSPISPGRTLEAATETGTDGRARLAVALIDADSAVVLALKNARGSELRSFSIVSPMPVRVRIDLGPAKDIGEARAEVRVVRGRAVVGAPASHSSTRGGLKTTNGTASFSSNLIFSGSFTFSVSGGPANTCGELDIYRNGTWEFTGGWLCTDGSGNATKGPWYWSDKPSDETGEPVFIRWPDNSATSSTFAIVDKNPAFTYIDSPMPTNSTPTSYYGHATDATWGTGFDFGYAAFSVFQNLTTGKYWNPGSGAYDSNSYQSVTPSFVSQSGRWYISWGGTYFPAEDDHVTGHQYRWYTCFTDAQSGWCTGASPSGWFPYEFTAD